VTVQLSQPDFQRLTRIVQNLPDFASVRAPSSSRRSVGRRTPDIGVATPGANIKWESRIVEDVSIVSDAYSYDLRRKVIEAIELDGMKKSEVSEVFHISGNTINLWLKRKADTGDYCAKSYKPPGHSHKITDWEKFRAFTVEHSARTQAQMAQLWCEEISDRTISRALEKIGFTRKKTYGYQERFTLGQASQLARTPWT
jgi:transposase